MPQFQTLVLTDRAATPVNRTFVPKGETNGVYTVVNSPSGIPIGESRYSLSTRRVGARIKTRIVFAVPVVLTETVNGISKPKAVREAIFDCTATFSAESTEEERNNAVGMFASSFATDKTLVHHTLVKAEGIY